LSLTLTRRRSVAYANSADEPLQRVAVHSIDAGAAFKAEFYGRLGATRFDSGQKRNAGCD
jgi:hypothetical protein